MSDKSEALTRELSGVANGAYRLANARVPAGFLSDAPKAASADIDGALLVDIDVEGGKIARIAPAGTTSSDGRNLIDLHGRIVWPTLVDIHTHLDKGQAMPRAMPDGTIVGGAVGTASDRAHWTADDIRKRMEFGLRCAFVHGVSAIRTHIDSNHELTERSWSVFRDLRDAWADRIVLQGVGLAPLDMFLRDEGVRLADLVATSRGILGGVTDGIGDDWGDTTQLDASLDRILMLAAEREMDVDLHVDQSAELAAFALPKIAEAVIRNDFAGRVLCGHCVNLALQPDDVLRRTLELCRDANLTFVTLPTTMMYLMDRTPGRTPRWRGVTAAKEIHAAGLPIAVGGDNYRDAWFAYGDHDMVDTFQQAVRVLHLDHPADPFVAMVGSTPAAIMGLKDVGSLGAGQPADMIVFSARTFSEFMSRPQADRTVLRRGAPITARLPDYDELDA